MSKLLAAGCAAALLLPVFAGWGSAAPMELDVTLTFSNLGYLSGSHYEGWLLVNGAPVSTGSFQVGMAGGLAGLDGAPKSVFHVPGVDIDLATRFVVSIEPDGDTDPAPSAIKPLGGDLNPSMTGAVLRVDVGGKSFRDIAGAYILATPSDGESTDERSGLWFLAFYGDQPPVAGLSLPTLNGTEWVYEGWTVVNGTPLSTGRFDRPDGEDGQRPYSADGPTPPFPGEDFLRNAPAGVRLPTDLRGEKALVTIEPRVDPDPAPFQLRALEAAIPPDAVDHTPYNMSDVNGTFPTGTVTMAAMRGNPAPGGVGSFALAVVAATVGVALVVAYAGLRRGGPKSP